ncbi:MAG: hypothetical protein ACLGPL_09855 [Acidobacteriota bacterium]
MKENTSDPHDRSFELARLLGEIESTTADYQNKMARFLFDISCLEGIERLRVSRKAPLRLFSRFKKVLSLYDAAVKASLGRMRRRGFTVQCAPGCTHCCRHMPAGVSAIELLHLYQGLHRSGLVERAFRRCLEANEQWAKVHSGGERDEDLTRYYRLEQPCPFLYNNLCSVYEYRPFACRMHFSLSSPHWCRSAHFQNEYAVRFNMEPCDRVLGELDRLDGRFGLGLSDILAPGLLELTVNVMRFERIRRP